MYIEDVKVFRKKGKRTGDPDTNKMNTQLWYRNGSEYWKMYDADNENWEMRINRRKRNVKSRKYKNSWRVWKLQVFENIGSKHHKASTKDEGKKQEKNNIDEREKLFCSRNFITGINPLTRN